MNSERQHSSSGSLHRQMNVLLVVVTVWFGLCEPRLAFAQPASTARPDLSKDPKAVELHEKYLALSQELRTRRLHNSAWFNTDIAGKALPDELREVLLPHLESYYIATGNQPEVYQLISDWYKEFRPGVPLMIGPPRVLVTKAGTVQSAAASLTLKSYQSFQLPELLEMNLETLRIIHAYSRSNRIWLEARTLMRSQETNTIKVWGVLFGLDLFKGTQDIVVFEPQHPRQPDTDALGDTVVIKGSGLLKTYDLRTKSQRNLTIAVDDDARPSFVNDRLFMVSTSSLALVDLKSGSTRVLASTRRRPPQTPMDTLDSLHPALLFPGPANTWRLQAGRDYYALGGNQAWSKLGGFEENTSPVNSFALTQADRRMVAVSVMEEISKIWSGASYRVYVMPADSNVPKYLLGPEPLPTLPGLPPPRQGPKPQWTVTQAPIPKTSSFALVGNNLWGLGDGYRRGGASGPKLVSIPGDGRPPVVVQTSYDENEPGVAEFKDLSANTFSTYSLLSVRGGLAAVCVGGNGYWFISDAELKTALQSAK